MESETPKSPKRRRWMFRLVVGILLLPFVVVGGWKLFDAWETLRIERIRARFAELKIATEPKRPAPSAADQELRKAAEEFQRCAVEVEAAIGRRLASEEEGAAADPWFDNLSQFNHAHFIRDMKSWRGELAVLRTLRTSMEYRSVLSAAQRFARAVRGAERSEAARNAATQGSWFYTLVGDKAACLLFAEALLALEDGDVDLSRVRHGQAAELAVSEIIRSNLRYYLQLVLEQRKSGISPEETAELLATALKLSRPVSEAWRTLLADELPRKLDWEWERLSPPQTTPKDGAVFGCVSKSAADLLLNFPRPARKQALLANYELLAEILAQSRDPDLPTLRDLAAVKEKCGPGSAVYPGWIPEFSERLRVEIELRLFEQARARAETIAFAAAASFATGAAFSPDAQLGLPPETWIDPTSGSPFHVRLERGEVVVWGAGFDQRDDGGVLFDFSKFPQVQPPSGDDLVVHCKIPTDAAP